MIGSENHSSILHPSGWVAGSPSMLTYSPVHDSGGRDPVQCAAAWFNPFFLALWALWWKSLDLSSDSSKPSIEPDAEWESVCSLCVCERGREGGKSRDGGTERVWKLEGWKRRGKENRERGKMEKKTDEEEKLKTDETTRRYLDPNSITYLVPTCFPSKGWCFTSLNLSFNSYHILKLLSEDSPFL